MAMDLYELKSRVDVAKSQRDAPPPPGGTKPVSTLSQHLEPEDWQLLWKMVRAFRKEHPRVFIKFPETLLADQLLHKLADLDGIPSLAQLAGELEATAASEGP